MNPIWETVLNWPSEHFALHCYVMLGSRTWRRVWHWHWSSPRHSQYSAGCCGRRCRWCWWYWCCPLLHGRTLCFPHPLQSLLALNPSDLRRSLIQCCPFVSAPSPEDPAAVPVAALKISVLVPSSQAGAGSSFRLLQVSWCVLWLCWANQVLCAWCSLGPAGSELLSVLNTGAGELVDSFPTHCV